MANFVLCFLRKFSSQKYYYYNTDFSLFQNGTKTPITWPFLCGLSVSMALFPYFLRSVWKLKIRRKIDNNLHPFENGDARWILIPLWRYLGISTHYATKKSWMDCYLLSLWPTGRTCVFLISHVYYVVVNAMVFFKNHQGFFQCSICVGNRNIWKNNLLQTAVLNFLDGFQENVSSSFQ